MLNEQCTNMGLHSLVMQLLPFSLAFARIWVCLSPRHLNNSLFCSALLGHMAMEMIHLLFACPLSTSRLYQTRVSIHTSLSFYSHLIQVLVFFPLPVSSQIFQLKNPFIFGYFSNCELLIRALWSWLLTLLLVDLQCAVPISRPQFYEYLCARSRFSPNSRLVSRLRF